MDCSEAIQCQGQPRTLMLIAAPRRWLAVLVVLLVAVGVGVGVPLALRAGGGTSTSLQERLELATRLLHEVPLVDGHNDLPWNIRKFLHNRLRDFRFGEDLRKVVPWSNSPWSHTDLPRLQAGLVAAQSLSGSVCHCWNDRPVWDLYLREESVALEKFRARGAVLVGPPLSPSASRPIKKQFRKRDTDRGE
ncbi:dipeptidase 3-like [Periplaneta americana]|uniref:dipeptidase 3-like n=1 Tax=Periplaneta americana TaxID=6978 RepID=UPI0037E98B3E